MTPIEIMQEEFLHLTNNGAGITAKEIREEQQIGEQQRFIPLNVLDFSIGEIIRRIRIEEQQQKEFEQATKPIKKFLFIEDGSVDLGELQEDLYNKNPEIKVVVYRQGSVKPMLENVED